MPGSTIQEKGIYGTTVSAVVSYTDGSFPTSSTMSTSSSTTTRYEKTRFWTNSPGYRNLIATGRRLPDNTFSFQEKRRHSGTVSVHSRTQSGFQVIDKTITYFGIGYSPFPITLNRRVTTSMMDAKLLEKASSSQWNVPVFLAEAGKTAEMVTSTAIKMANLVRLLRKGRVGEFLDTLRVSKSDKIRTTRGREKAVRRFNSKFGTDSRKAAGSTWLEYTYGWTPFMSDVRSASTLLQDLAEEEGNLIARVVATARDRQSKIVVTPSFPKVTRIYEQTDSYRDVWSYKLKTLSIPARLGLTNPMVVAWELLPFSFVADWFLPVGDYLSTLDTPLRFGHVGGVRGLRQELFETDVYSGADSTTQWSGSASGSILNVSRVPLTSLPSPRFSEMLFQPKLNTSRATSSIALLQQNLKWFR